MESKEADALRKAWGDKPCEHPWWVEETSGRAATVRVVCTTCGQARLKGKTLEAETLEIETLEVETKTDSEKDTATNQKVKDLDAAVDGIVAMLRTEFAFTMQDEAKIGSVMGKLHDAFGRWREGQQKKKRST
ncbi:MAG TPA: hypothetical protein VE201_05995 [Nitrospirales bacterium]|nr:hypothetical protein [Nitrospirales bacterium]